MKIKFIPQNIEVEGSSEKSLLQIATENKLEIRSICKGVPSCAECRIRITEGETNILPPNKAELNLIGTNYFIDGRRLSCQVHCFGDITVDMTEQLEKIENQSKKIRGFRANKHVESKAVNDTMLLTEKPDDRPSQPERAAAPEKPATQAKQQERQNQDRSKGQDRKQQDRRPQDRKPQQDRKNQDRKSK